MGFASAGNPAASNVPTASEKTIVRRVIMVDPSGFRFTDGENGAGRRELRAGFGRNKDIEFCRQRRVDAGRAIAENPITADRSVSDRIHNPYQISSSAKNDCQE